MRRNLKVASVALVVLLTACGDAEIRQARKNGAAASISLGKTISGLKTLNQQDLITDEQELAALAYVEKVNSPLLEAGKRLKGVSRGTWDGVKGDVLGLVDKALTAIDEGGNLVFKSPEAKATFNTSVAAARAAIALFRSSLVAIRSAQ